MSASEAGPVIVGAAIGAGGAVIAQVTSAVFTARRETARLQWEKQRQVREWKMREAERFMTSKQELYSRYLAVTYKPIMTLVLLTKREYNESPDWEKLLPPYTDEFEAELNVLRSNMKLLAPPVVHERLEYAHGIMVAAMLKIAINDSSLEWRHTVADDALRAWQQLSNVMHVDLRGDEESLQGIAAKIYGEKRESTHIEASIKHGPWHNFWHGNSPKS